MKWNGKVTERKYIPSRILPCPSCKMQSLIWVTEHSVFASKKKTKIFARGKPIDNAYVCCTNCDKQYDMQGFELEDE